VRLSSVVCSLFALVDDNAGGFIRRCSEESRGIGVILRLVFPVFKGYSGVIGFAFSQ
jgi:hypothetical protein